MRSAPAIALCRFAHSTEICWIGWLKRWTYCRKVMIRPIEMVAPKRVWLRSRKSPPVTVVMAMAR